MLPTSFVMIVHEEKVNNALREIEFMRNAEPRSPRAEPLLARIGQLVTGLVRQPVKPVPVSGCGDAIGKPCAA